MLDVGGALMEAKLDPAAAYVIVRGLRALEKGERCSTQGCTWPAVTLEEDGPICEQCRRQLEAHRRAQLAVRVAIE